MTQFSVKTSIQNISQKRLADTPLITVLRYWMTITGLDFKDAIHVSFEEMSRDLENIHDRLASVVDVLDDDQAQEAACRLLEQIHIYSDDMDDEEVSARSRITVKWDGSAWQFICDPKLRLRESKPRFVDAREAVLKMLAPE